MPSAFHNLDELRRLRARFTQLTAGPGLFHATRVRLNGKPCNQRDVRQGWDAFLGRTVLREFHTSETAAGPSYQQGCYFGALGKLDDYTSLATAAVGKFPPGAMPITFHHRDARVDRDQWTLSLYRAAAQFEWEIYVDPKGKGPYARFDIDPKDALSIVSPFCEQEKRAHLLHQIGVAIRKRGLRPPRFIYAMLATELFDASRHVMDHYIEDIESSKYEPKPGVLLPNSERSSAPSWPPDGKWHFRSGEAAFCGRIIPLKGMLWVVLKVFAMNRTPLTCGDLLRLAWDNDRKSHSTVRTTLSNVRQALRAAFELPFTIDPLPRVDRGDNVAWSLDEDALRRGIQPYPDEPEPKRGRT